MEDMGEEERGEKRLREARLLYMEIDNNYVLVLKSVLLNIGKGSEKHTCCVLNFSQGSCVMAFWNNKNKR